VRFDDENDFDTEAHGKKIFAHKVVTQIPPISMDFALFDESGIGDQISRSISL